MVLATNNTKTVPVAIYNFISYTQIDWGGLIAAAVLITLPVLVLAVVTERYVVRGLTAGAIKGKTCSGSLSMAQVLAPSAAAAIRPLT